MKRLLVLIAFSTACASVPPKPPVIAPTPPAGYSMGATVRSTAGATFASVAATITPDFGSPVPCTFDPGSSRLACPVPAGVYHGDLDVTAPKFKPWHRHVDFVVNYDEITLAPSFVALPQLVPIGRTLRPVDGTRWTAIESSDFNLYNRFLGGEDIEPVLEQRQHPDPAHPELGYTLLRVWTGFNVCPTGIGPDGKPCQQIGRLVPREHPEFYRRLPEFLEHAAGHHLYVEIVAFTGPYGGIFANDDEKVAHWEALKAAACGQTGVAYLELVNEYDNAPNADLPFARLSAPTCPGLLASHGSGTQDHQPLQPYWSVVTYRPAPPETWRKAGHNAGELTGFRSPPVLSNEGLRFPDQDNDPNHAYDMAAGCALLSAGCAFHSVHGKNSTLWDGDELRDAQAFAAGAHSVPLDPCQDLNYENLGQPDGLLRLYRTGGLAICTVPIRR